jgi:hypothetical protein
MSLKIYLFIFIFYFYENINGARYPSNCGGSQSYCRFVGGDFMYGEGNNCTNIFCYANISCDNESSSCGFFIFSIFLFD